ncbi:MAG: aspartate aminotransferase family protein [Bacteroidota bacterium]
MEQDFLRYTAQTSPLPMGIPVSRAAGIYLYGPNGERWVDFISGICVSNLGHGVPEIIQAIQQQSEAYLHPMVYGEAIMAPQVQYARRLGEILGPRLESVYFLGSGAEAVEGALKVAKKYTGRAELLGFFGSYHGSTHGALSVSDGQAKRAAYAPLLPESKLIPYNDHAALAEITEKTAGVIIEPIQGAGGMVVPDEGYLQAVQARCREVGALMILDEIQTGFGRTGALFAHQTLGLEPDILLLAKSLGGGLPLGAFLTRQEVMQVIRENPVLGHLTTFGGHPLCCASGLAALEVLLGQPILEGMSAREKLMKSCLQHPAIQDLRGRGLMYALLLPDGDFAETVRQKALEKGLITIGFLHIRNGLRLCPPLNISLEEMEMCCEILLEAISETAAERA